MAMNNADHGYQIQIDQLREQGGYDFVSLAFEQSASNGFVITWQYASGNLNNRYKRIVLQSGRGIAGIVFKTGKPMVVPNVLTLLPQEELFNYPILVSERLRSLAALPLFQHDRVAGVLLVGYREVDRMTKLALEQLQHMLGGSFGSFVTKELSFHDNADRSPIS